MSPTNAGVHVLLFTGSQTAGYILVACAARLEYGPVDIETDKLLEISYKALKAIKL
jgi:hypothetical protein